MKTPQTTGTSALLLLAVLGFAVVVEVPATEPDWAVYDEFLATHVTRGTLAGVSLNVVDYAAMRRDPGLAAVAAIIEDHPVAQLEGQAEMTAFLINAYNILTLRLLAQQWPVDSIRDLGRLFRPVWKRPVGTIDGTSVSLDEIEHARLRPFGDPRIHFAIVCASVSCPDLRVEAYRGARLEEQLERQTREFLENDAKGLRISGTTIEVSRIFKWFAEDFANDGGIGAFVRRYRELPDPVRFRATMPYNWSVNAAPRTSR